MDHEENGKMKKMDTLLVGHGLKNRRGIGVNRGVECCLLLIGYGSKVFNGGFEVHVSVPTSHHLLSSFYPSLPFLELHLHLYPFFFSFSKLINNVWPMNFIYKFKFWQLKLFTG